MNKKTFLIIITIVILAAAVILRLTGYRLARPAIAPAPGNSNSLVNNLNAPTSSTEPLIGGDRDEHGCLGPAGYSWCEVKQKCLRPFEEICNSVASNSDIILTSPLSDEIISSPLAVAGSAPGNWFFEANIPVKLIDNQDKVIAQVGGTAIDDWMTEKTVRFKANLNFTTTATSGFLVIAKDNPSGLPENDAAVKFPVRFKNNQ